MVVMSLPYYSVNQFKDMDEDLCNPAALLKRISELERERDELQLDIEQLCMQQSGMSSKADALSKIQTRRLDMTIILFFFSKIFYLKKSKTY